MKYILSLFILLTLSCKNLSQDYEGSWKLEGTTKTAKLDDKTFEVSVTFIDDNNESATITNVYSYTKEGSNFTMTYLHTFDKTENKVLKHFSREPRTLELKIEVKNEKLHITDKKETQILTKL